MHLTLLSKKLITAIIATTFISIALVGVFESESKSNKSMQQTLNLDTLENSENEKELADLEKEKQDVLIKSLTNVTHNVVFEPDSIVHFTGYIQGSGYASYQFYAQENQLFKASLPESENQLFELIVFGNETFVLKNNETLKIPSNALYELRLVFRADIEQEEEDSVQSPSPEEYHLTLELQNSDEQEINK